MIILNEILDDIRAASPQQNVPASESDTSTSSSSVGYETVNILDDESLRAGMKEYSSWPTFPQLYIGGEFVGGSDIVIGLYQSGELVEMIEKALAE